MSVGANVEIDPQTRIANLENGLFGGPNPQGTLGASEQKQVLHLSGSADNVPVNAALQTGTYSIETAGVDAIVLGNPVSGGPGTGDDGKVLQFIDTTGHAHTITANSNKIAPSHHLITFNGTVGSSVTLQALNGLFQVTGSSGVTVS